MSEYDKLGTRAGFNNAIRHLQTTIYVDEQLTSNQNIADILNSEIDEGNILNYQALPIVNALLVTKHGYLFKSFNIAKQISEFDFLVEEIGKWNALDFVLTYHHPTIGFSVINPKNKSHLDKIRDIMKDELIVVYCRYIGREKNENKSLKTAGSALTSLIRILNGVKFSGNKEYLDGTPPRPEVPLTQPAGPEGAPAVAGVSAQAPPTGHGVSITPKYSVQVSNELFHNGNVEAWKNIIESFVTSHSELNVTVYHEGELIQDLNTLFKWGKVKHGGLIFFQVSGKGIKNVSKLKRYLHEGASQRYESFLKMDINRPLKLF